MVGAILLAACALAQVEEAPAARGKDGLTVSRAALEALVLERHGYGEKGRELLDLFLKARLLDSLAAQRGIVIGGAEVAQRWRELEKRSQAGGLPLRDEIERRNLSDAQFREFLRLALVQEKLTRAALGLAPGTEVPGDKQEVWLQQEIAARGLEILPPAAGTDGILARCGEIAVTRAEFARFLCERLECQELEESAWHALLLQAIERSMPDLSRPARERAVEEELARRRRKHDAEFPAITFEQRLGATGRTLDGLRRDPSVSIAALSRLWVERTAGPEGVRRAYEEERELFESRYGEAVRAALLFRVAGRFVNDLCPRTFEQAEEELRKLAKRVSSQEEFSAQVERMSEDPGTKKQRGDLGWVTRGDARVPRELREALFHVLATGGTISEPGRLVGPVRLDSGVALLWAAARRASPGWEEMAERVHEELRRRFIDRVMPRASVELVDADE
jgi:hypothetical protein